MLGLNSNLMTIPVALTGDSGLWWNCTRTRVLESSEVTVQATVVQNPVKLILDQCELWFDFNDQPTKILPKHFGLQF